MNMHIHASKGIYLAQVKKAGHRIWETVGDVTTLERAAEIAAKNLANGNYKRGRVLFCAEWYEPNIVMEMKK